MFKKIAFIFIMGSLQTIYSMKDSMRSLQQPQELGGIQNFNQPNTSHHPENLNFSYYSNQDSFDDKDGVNYEEDTYSSQESHNFIYNNLYGNRNLYYYTNSEEFNFGYSVGNYYDQPKNFSTESIYNYDINEYDNPENYIDEQKYKSSNYFSEKDENLNFYTNENKKYSFSIKKQFPNVFGYCRKRYPKKFSKEDAADKSTDCLFKIQRLIDDPLPRNKTISAIKTLNKVADYLITNFPEDTRVKKINSVYMTFQDIDQPESRKLKKEKTEYIIKIFSLHLLQDHLCELYRPKVYFYKDLIEFIQVIQKSKKCNRSAEDQTEKKPFVKKDEKINFKTFRS